ncbi:glycosyltransferase [Flavobacterium sp. UBA7680]|uniref:glycosyltransferase n=1 Tax=Flavobacterium sp. UBA7680 TaxID=1946559 RepID=UPI0025B9558F|nr:glycosyltransferase [Flavobacterium sp. UBA7680]
MRIVQLIDSLESGGAERMAVNYANALSKEITFSGLIATRKEGELIHQISENVSYLFLNKKRKIDFKVIFKLRRYILENKVTIIHAHSSSFFTAVLVKLTFVKIKIVWHDHYGSRVNESWKQNKVLIFLSVFFSSIFVVNYQLRNWSQKTMLCKKVVFIPNFTIEEKDDNQITNLKGIEGKRIVVLANLKNPKNHILILKAFQDLKLQDSDWTLHLIGRDYLDEYSNSLKSFIKHHELEKHIHLYGERKDVKHILSQADIGVLASTEEGFPVALLEYAMSNLGVVSTNVGFCAEIIQHEVTGLVFSPFNDLELKVQLEKMIKEEQFRKTAADNFRTSVMKNYSEKVVIEKLMSEYKKLN